MLKIAGLRAGYGPMEVLHGIDLVVPKGSVVALIGANGAGKTTLLRAVSGLLPAGAGHIALDGQRINGLEPHRIARLGVAHVPQGRRVFAGMSVADNLKLGAFRRLRRGGGRRPVQLDLDMVMRLFPRLRERQRQLAGTLSGGEQQMLAIARALMLDPAVLLLDEPSTGLSSTLVEEVFSIIDELRAMGVTLLLVEQFAATALLVADHGYVLENGVIGAHGRARDLRGDPAVEAAYLGTLQ